MAERLVTERLVLRPWTADDAGAASASSCWSGPPGRRALFTGGYSTSASSRGLSSYFTDDTIAALNE